MKKKIVMTVALLLAFAVGCADEKEKREQEERNAQISESAQEIQKTNEELIRLLERGPGHPTAKE